MKTFIVLLAVVSLAGCRMRVLEKQAQLVLPVKIAFNHGSPVLDPVMIINWDVPQPLEVPVVMKQRADLKPDAPTVVGWWKIYHANGTEAEQAAGAMAVAEPNGTYAIRYRGRVALPLATTDTYTFSKSGPGRYYAIAQIAAKCAGHKVSITTDKCWFELTETP